MDFLRLIKFSTVGAIGAVINMGSLWILTELWGIFYLFSSVVAIEITIIMLFMMNDRWTFNDRKSTHIGQFIKRFLKSNLWRSGGLTINIGVLFFLTEYMGVYYFISNIFGIICAFLLNYILESRLTWKIDNVN